MRVLRGLSAIGGLGALLGVLALGARPLQAQRSAQGTLAVTATVVGTTAPAPAFHPFAVVRSAGRESLVARVRQAPGAYELWVELDDRAAPGSAPAVQLRDASGTSRVLRPGMRLWVHGSALPGGDAEQEVRVQADSTRSAPAAPVVLRYTIVPTGY